MTEFLKKSFTVPMQGDETYRDNWERTFGKKVETLPDTLREPAPNSRCGTAGCYYCYGSGDWTKCPILQSVERKNSADE